MKYTQHLQQSNQRAKGTGAESLQNHCPNPSSVKCLSTFPIRTKQASVTVGRFHLCKCHCIGFCLWIEVSHWHGKRCDGYEQTHCLHGIFSGGMVPLACCLLEQNANTITTSPLYFLKAETFTLNSKAHNSLHFVAGLLSQGMPVRLASHVFIKAWLFQTISFTTFGSDFYNLDHLKLHCQFC